MAMQLNFTRLLCFIWCLPTFISSAKDGFPCSTQYSMKPNTNAKPQNIEENPPPFKLSILNSKGEQVRFYKDETYTVKLTADETFFRGFLMQARLSTRQGFIIGHLRSGEFLPDPTWEEEGVKIQKCPPIFNDSLTNKDDEKKFEIQAKWKSHGNDGPIQFVMTVVQERDLYWHQWSPETGLLLPDKNAKFTEQLSIPKDLINDKDDKIGFESKFIASSSNGSDINSFELFDNKVSQKPPVTRHPSTTPVSKENPLTTPVAEEFPLTTPPASEKHKQVSTRKFRTRSTTTTEAQPQTITEELQTTEEIKEITVSLKEGVIKSDVLPPFVDPGIKISQKASTKDKDKQVSKNDKEPDTIDKNRDYCTSAPCSNNGTCKNLPESDRYECICESPWGGLDCKEEDLCAHSGCKNGASCTNGETNYTCHCTSGWAGQFCDRNCPGDVCKNDGTCTIDDTNHYKCICKPGFTGDRCEINIDECASNPCFNNASCFDQANGFECRCLDGYMGDRCHRPCQDIYHSCQFWQEQDRCESQRPSTKFFDINCASTCGQCVYENNTVSTTTPLPPLLEPFEFLLGKWVINFSDPMRYPMDFVKTPKGYYEEIQFIVPPVTMFGTPSLNYSAIAVNNDDPKDTQINVGFLTLSAAFRPIKVSLMSTGNDGLTLIEEGELSAGNLKMQAEYLVVNPLIHPKAPKLLKREFSIQGAYLQESVSRTSAEGQISSFTKYYSKQSSEISYF